MTGTAAVKIMTDIETLQVFGGYIRNRVMEFPEGHPLHTPYGAFADALTDYASRNVLFAELFIRFANCRIYTFDTKTEQEILPASDVLRFIDAIKMVSKIIGYAVELWVEKDKRSRHYGKWAIAYTYKERVNGKYELGIRLGNALSKLSKREIKSLISWYEEPDFNWDV